MEVKIYYTEERGWEVHYDNKSALKLGYEEMIGLVSSITMPYDRLCLQWLKTKKENKKIWG